MLRAPVSSEFDPSEEAEGSVDPLGLQPGYERLADRLLPAVTVRMGRPRFVTAMAVGACICESWDADAIAADEITPPWLVWEWFVVEALVRAGDTLTGIYGVPGYRKVQWALRNQRPVCASAYLKTPGTFGFTGVFRRLAVQLEIITQDGRLDESGYQLVAAWAKDQGLEGFLDATHHALRERLRRAITQGMERGQTTRQPTDFWTELARRLDPAAPGPNERTVLLDRIRLRAGPIEFTAGLTKELITRGGLNSRDEEPDFIRKLTAHAPEGFKHLLTAIDAYEAFGRAITDAFDALRYCSSFIGGGPIDAEAFSSVESAKSALAVLAPSIARIRTHPTLLEWDEDQASLASAIAHFDAVRTGEQLFSAILTYHEGVQNNKPPSGKRSWFERAPRDRVVVRSGYSLREAPAASGGYVHEYRIPTFSGFLSDLGALQ
ncbi:hypothetical protein JQ594_28545 [Bradyrhizobium manausense]|uniref:hypothetical protein n=1 Tax=Bradyrhizobium manausense TaxID=989370 RepID=UPI001BA516B6|nr:hypothetical protein [Bradyrhizobium manausense]MBR0689890.1 hypothetical protein [Bradyrhizobium manausense]